MIEGCVEDLLCSLVSSFDIYAAEFSVPCLVSRLCCGLEVPAREFCSHIGACSFDADRRKSYLHEHLLSFFSSEISLCEKRHVVNAVDLDVLKRL